MILNSIDSPLPAGCVEQGTRLESAGGPIYGALGCDAAAEMVGTDESPSATCPSPIEAVEHPR